MVATTTWNKIMYRSYNVNEEDRIHGRVALHYPDAECTITI